MAQTVLKVMQGMAAREIMTRTKPREVKSTPLRVNYRSILSPLPWVRRGILDVYTTYPEHNHDKYIYHLDKYELFTKRAGAIDMIHVKHFTSAGDVFCI